MLNSSGNQHIRPVDENRQVDQGCQNLADELQQARETARENELRYQHLFENAPLCIFEIDLQRPTAIRSANPRAEAVYGWSVAELVTLSPTQLIPPDSLPEIQRMIVHLRAGETVMIETKNQRKDGSIFPVRVIATPEISSHNNHIVVTVEDITAQKERQSEAEAINAERRRIAQEIHDGIAQSLAALRIKIPLWHKWADMNPQTLHAEFELLKRTIDNGIDELRRSIHALRPVALDEAGFFNSIRQAVQDCNNQFPIYIELDINGPESRLPSSLELPLFRAIQEAMNNIIKHSQARLAWVTLDLTGKSAIRMVIRDNGRGFKVCELDKMVRGGHLGLKQMAERIEKNGGMLCIESQPGQGTCLEIQVPYEGRGEVGEGTGGK